MAQTITNLKEFFKESIKKKCKVIEVIVKQYYVTYRDDNHEPQKLKKEWFEDYSLNDFHAYRDASMVKNAEKIISVDFLTLENVDKKIDDFPKKNKIFELDEEQTRIYENWRKGLPKGDCGAIGEETTFTFTPTGLGMIIRVRKGNQELDLTNDNW